jgi:hypothetical protein
MTSRQVGLTAAFLAMAAGGTAACDAAPADPVLAEPPRPSASPSPKPTRSPSASPKPTLAAVPKPSPTPSPTPAEDVFYCADADRSVVADDFCDEESADYDSASYFLWHSRTYRHDLGPGYRLSDGSRIALTDRSARIKAGLPATGFVGNGSVKTNIVGRASTGGYTGEDDDGYGSGG